MPWKTEATTEIKDNLSIRNTINGIKNQMEYALRDVKYNTNESRTEIKMRLNPYLDNLVREHLVQDYRVVCDNTNNSPEVVDKGRIVVDAIQPSRTIENIHLRVTVVKPNKKNKDPKGQIFCEIDPYGEENWED